MNSDFTSKDTSLWSSGICIVLMASMITATNNANLLSQKFIETTEGQLLM